MDPRINPFAPGAGTKPPVLAGRQGELDAFGVILARLRDSRGEQSVLLTGLRGVGKTVLLREFEQTAAQSRCVVSHIEVQDSHEFAMQLAQICRKSLLGIAPKAKWLAGAKKAASALRSFNLSVSPDGSLTAGLGVEALEGIADSGIMSADFTELYCLLGEAARDHGTVVVILLDEVQKLDKENFAAVISAAHRATQLELPISLICAGLPSLSRMAAEAISYSERLFRFPRLDRLSEEDVRVALGQPLAPFAVTISEEALQLGFAFTEGYPYFVQEFGKAIWNVSDGPVLSAADATQAISLVNEHLDESLFKVRAERCSKAELLYARAMAELHSQECRASDVAQLLGKNVSQVATTKSRLGEKGVIFEMAAGVASFTVPKFDDFLRRTVPFDAA